MIKNYFISLFLFGIFLGTASAFAQEGRTVAQKQETIDGLSVYPNPVSSGKIYVTSKSAQEKDIEIFDVLGKKILQVTSVSKEVNIANLTPGVYIIKIREGEAIATRKLIVK